MAIPDYQGCMLPLLEIIKDGQDHRAREVTEAVANRLNLTQQELTQRLPSGQQTVIANRVAWAQVYLKKAGLLTTPVRGVLRITEEGIRVLTERPQSLTTQFLKRYETLRRFVEDRPDRAENGVTSTSTEAKSQALTPAESMEMSHQTLRSELAEELLDRVMECSPRFFEELVVDLLVTMGYGGSRADAGEAIGRQGDGGIDGIIKEDRLGLDVVCIQAKRWEGTVGRPEVQKFVGSMEGNRARKGVSSPRAVSLRRPVSTLGKRSGRSC